MTDGRGGISGALGTVAALGAVGACASASALYAMMRAVQLVVYAEPDPARIVWSPHAGYFWRVWTAGYLGVAVGMLVAWAAHRAPERVARALVPAVCIAAAMLFLQGVLLP